MEGGFISDDEKKYTTEEFFSVVILPSLQSFPLSDANIPDKVEIMQFTI